MYSLSIEKSSIYIKQRLDEFCKIGTDNPDLTEDSINNIKTVNLIGGITVLLNFIPGLLLFSLTRHYLIFIPSTMEGLLFMAVPLLNLWHRYNQAVMLMFIVHCCSAVYFGLLFGATINVDGIAFFLVGSVFYLFQSNRARIMCVIVSILIPVFLEINYAYNLVTPILLNDYNGYIVKLLATSIVMFLNGLVLYFYISSLLKKNKKQKQLIAEKEALVQHQELLIEERTAQLKISEARMENFLTKMSHDMRLGLNNMVLSNAFIEFEQEKQQLDGKVIIPSEYFEIINTSTRDLQQMVNNTLDISKIKKGFLEEPALSFIRVKPWLKERLRLLNMKAIRKNVQMILTISENVPPRIVSDIGRMNRILDNILSNALKFTNVDTSIELTLTMDETETAFKFYIKDQGPGIPVHEQEKIFKEFVSTSAGLTEGSGVGLTNARELASSLNATITVNSELGNGATFCISHPILTINNLKNNTVSSATALKDDFQGARILIIDDDEFSSKLFNKLLTNDNCLTEVAANMASGMIIANKVPSPDLIIIDRNLPDGDGFKFVETLKSSHLTKDIPIIMVSADATDTSQEEAKQIGVEEYVTKPTDIRTIRRTIRRHLSTKTVND